MMPLVTGALQCFTVLMELGKLDLDEGSCTRAQLIIKMYYIEVSYDIFQLILPTFVQVIFLWDK